MKEIIEQVNIYLKKLNPSYEVWSYGKTDNKYLFSYMSKVENPNEYSNIVKKKDNYYTPLIDNSIVEYDIKTHKIRTICITANLDVISKLDFIKIKDAE